MEETQLLEGCSPEKHESKQDHSVSERGEPLAKLRVLKNNYFPEAEFPLYLGNNVLGRDPTSCSLVFNAPSVSKIHAVISVSVFPGDKFCDGPVTEALLWDLGSLNGTRKGRFRLTPNVRYALSEGDFLVLADVLCQYITVSKVLLSNEKDTAVVERGLRGRGKPRGRGRRRGTERKVQGKGRSDGEKDSDIKDRAQEEQQGCELATPNPARTTALSLEQTPAQQENLLEFASESDSDEDSTERREKKQKRRKFFLSDSDSPQLSGPTCSTFLSPTDNIVPESEDENSMLNGKTEEKDPAGSKRNVMVGESELEEEESLIHITERAAKAHNGHQSVQVEKEGDAPTNNLETSLSASVLAVKEKGEEGQKTFQHGSARGIHSTSTQGMSGLHMDSDTDVEGEEEVKNVSGTLSEPATSSIAPSAPTELTAPKIPVIEPGKIYLDSDTDIEDNEDSVSTTTPLLNSSPKGESVPTAIAAKFHLDSDTDSEGVTEGPAKSDPMPEDKATPSRALLGKPQQLHMNSDTDPKDVDGHQTVTPQIRPLAGQAAAARPGLCLEIHSDSDSQAEEDSTQMFVPSANAKPNPVAQTEPQQGSSVIPAMTVIPGLGPTTKTNVQEQDSVNQYQETQPLPIHAVDPSDFNLESDTDVEDEEDRAVRGAQETNATPSILAEQNCSRPPGSESAVPSLVKLKHFIDDQDNDKDDDDFVVAETQPFVLDVPAESRQVTDPMLDSTQLYVQDSPQAMEPSATEAVEDQTTQIFPFRCGLSDSSHMHSMTERYSYASVPMAEQKAQEVEDPGPIQMHKDAPTSGSTGFVETDGDLEATQAYGALPSTMISSPGQDNMGQPEGGMEEGVIWSHSRNPQLLIEKENVEETQPMDFHADSHLSTADTQPVSALEAREERGLRPDEEEVEEVVTEPPPQKSRGEEKRNYENVQPSRNSRRSRGGEQDEEGEIESKQPVKRMTQRASKAETKQGQERRGTEPEEDEESGKEADEVLQDQCSLIGKIRRRRNTNNTIKDKKNDNGETEAAKGLKRGQTEKKIKEVEKRQAENRPDHERKESEEKVQKAERENDQREKQEQMEPEENKRQQTEQKEQEVQERQERVKTQCKERGKKELLEIAGNKEQDELEKGGRKLEEIRRLGREENPRKEERGESEKAGQEKLEEEKVLQHEHKNLEENQKLKKKKKNKEGVENHKEEEEKQETDKMLKRGNQRRKEETANKETAEQESDKGLTTSTRGKRKTTSRIVPSVSTDSSEDTITTEAEPKPGRSSSLTAVSSTMSRSSTGQQKRGRGMKTLDPDPVNSASPEVNAGLKKSGRGSKGQIVTDSNTLSMETEIVVVPVEKPAENSKPKASRSRKRGQKQCDPVIADLPDPTSSSVLVKRSRRGNKSEMVSDVDSKKSQSDQTAVTVEAQSCEVQGSQSSGKQRCRKRGLGEDMKETEEDSNVKMDRVINVSQEVAKMEREKAEQTEKMEESERQSMTFLRRGRASKAKKMQLEAQVDTEEEAKEEEVTMISVHRKIRGSQRAAHKNESEEKKVLEEDQNKEAGPGTNSEDLENNSEKTEVPQTPTTRNSRKRSSANASPIVAKMTRHSPSCAADENTYKVLFTGLTDDQGEATVVRLGGSVAKGVNDMTHLITDKVRRTVKFLCAVARGVPVVTTAWLEKCGKSGTFLSPSTFLVKDVEQEKKFNFCLEESLQMACNQPLLQGYEIHVTRSVKPEPAQMKDIISCSGARYLPKMPTVQKPNTVVISCVEDASLCGPALSASLPVLSAEFLLTGILRQKVDLVTHMLTGPLFKAKSSCKGRNRK